MIQTRKLMVFDFDGVVCDSTNECLVTSWNAWERWESRSCFRNDLSKFTKEDKLNFQRLRPRVKGAGEYYILRRAFAESINIETRKTYSQLEREWKDNFLPFKEVFFNARTRLQHGNLDNWIDLHLIYKDVIEVMRILNSQGRLYMATLKDSESVRLILGKQGLKIPVENLLDQSKINSKKSNSVPWYHKTAFRKKLARCRKFSCN